MATVAELLRPLLAELIGEQLPLRVRAWDGSESGPADSPATLVIRSPDAIRRLLWAPHELGLARAFVTGDLDVEGDLYAALTLPGYLAHRDREARVRPLTLLRAARAVGALKRPLPPPPEEARLRGGRHSKERDAAAIAHHYDVGNGFYRLVLGPTMVYSCAFFETADASLEQAQTAKLDLICRKLGLQPGQRLLDVGCGWGSLVIHATKHYGVRAVGVTISREQADLAEKRLGEEGLADVAEIRVQDYRDVADGPYDAIASIGMAEHVGLDEMRRYATALHDLLRPGGRVLNHQISRRPGPPGRRNTSFIWHYVFPDGELAPVGHTVQALEEAGLEVRDVEAMREHYALTLRHWVANLERHWAEAVALVGARRARVWRLYMAGAALSFESGRIGVNQVLGVRQTDDGRSGLPLTRTGWLSGS